MTAIQLAKPSDAEAIAAFQSGRVDAVLAGFGA